jgi:plastocyanin
MQMRQRFLAPLLAAGGLVLAACGASGGSLERVERPATAEADASVEVVDLAFSPEATEIKAGDTVAWRWDRARIEHDVSFKDAPASPIQRSGSWQRTFDTPGTYDYVCTLHANMKGRVVVR